MTPARSIPLRHALAWAINALPLLLFAAMFVYIGIQAPWFFNVGTMILAIQNAVPILIIALGLATVIVAGGEDVISGGIDISVPAAAVLGAGVIADLLVNHGAPFAVAALAGMGAALAVGVVNAVLVVRLGLSALLATLTTFVAGVGVTNWVTDASRITVDHPVIIWLRDSAVAGLPVNVWAGLILVVALVFLVHQSRWGLRLQAVGGNRSAARLAGLRPARYIAASYVIAAGTGGMAAFFILARGSGSTPGTETNLLIEMVLAGFIGAVFSPRRVVTVWGAALGAILVSILSVGFQSIGINIFWTGLVKGILILTVVASAALAAGLRQ